MAKQRDPETPRMPQIPEDVQERGRHPLDQRDGWREGELARVKHFGADRPEGPSRQAMEAFKARQEIYGGDFKPARNGRE